jgi:hypothetical protein
VLPAGGRQALLLGLGIGAGITGLVAIIAEHGSKSMVAPMLVIWVIVAVAALGAAVVNRYRNIRGSALELALEPVDVAGVLP